MSMLVILLLRLVLHKLPNADIAASGWLALGPIDMGALGLLLPGVDAPAVFAVAGLSGEVAFSLGIIGGTLLWGHGAWWLLLAILKTVRYCREGMPFNLGWSGFIFPVGIYSLAALALARAARHGFFSVVGSTPVICLVAIWFIVAVLTVDAVWHGSVFARAPFLIDSNEAAAQGPVLSRDVNAQCAARRNQAGHSQSQQ
jgi:tellurite resistance protein TehA-like permease